MKVEMWYRPSYNFIIVSELSPIIRQTYVFCIIMNQILFLTLIIKLTFLKKTSD